MCKSDKCTNKNNFCTQLFFVQQKQLTTIVCATKQLGIKISEEELARTKYPDGITFPKSTRTVFPRDKSTKTKIKRYRRESEAIDDATDSQLAEQDVEQAKFIPSSDDETDAPALRRTTVAFDHITFG